MAKQPVLSIWQPWASLVASGEKTIETRLEEAPEELIGKRIYIHSSTITSRSHVYDWLESRYPDAMKSVYAKHSRQDLPTAMVIATAVLSECRKTDWRDWPSTMSPVEDFWGWVLDDVSYLETFIPLDLPRGLHFVELE